MKKSKIYTGTGDKGTTQLATGQRVSKCDIGIKAYGTIDELNSFIGLLMAECPPSFEPLLSNIQNNLFNIGSYLSMRPFSLQSTIQTEDINEIELEIDKLDAALPPLHAFVLPSGNRTAATAHICRSICRRAERGVIEAANILKQEIDPLLITYLNRLSDFFFLLARTAVISNGQEEKLWKK